MNYNLLSLVLLFTCSYQQQRLFSSKVSSQNVTKIESSSSTQSFTGFGFSGFGSPESGGFPGTGGSPFSGFPDFGSPGRGGSPGGGSPPPREERSCAESRTKNPNYTIKNKYLRNKRYFTQGLLFDGEQLVESTGGYGTSYIHRLNLDEENKTVQVIGESVEIDDELFGEGCTILQDSEGTKHIYQLTWKAGKVFKYDMNFQLVAELELPSEIKEGWGLTHDPERPTIGIISEGSENLFEVDAADGFRVINKTRVLRDGRPVDNLNELEWIEGEIWSNIFTSDFIIRVDPESGNLLRSYDMENLIDEAKCDLRSEFGANFDSDSVLNGIAYNQETGKIYVTGKLWAFIYEIEFEN